MTIAKVAAVLTLVSLISAAAYRMAIAEDAIGDNTRAIDRLTTTAEQLTRIIQSQEAEKKAKRETEARLCGSGAISNRQWCVSNGYEVPTTTNVEGD